MPKIEPATEVVGFNVYLTSDEANTILSCLDDAIEFNEGEKNKLNKNDEYYHEDAEHYNIEIRKLKSISKAFEDVWENVVIRS